MIRVKNLDLETDGMKRLEQVRIGDITATVRYPVFVAPVACVLNFVDLYSMQAMAGQSSSDVLSVAVHLSSATATYLTARRSTSASDATHSDTISAAARYRLTPSANNSLTAGTIVGLQFSAAGSAVLSAVLVHVTYTPLKNRVR